MESQKNESVDEGKSTLSNDASLHSDGAETLRARTVAPHRRKKSFVRDAFILVSVLFLIGIGYVALSWKDANRESARKIEEKTLAFVKENMVQPGTEVKISNFVREGSLYRVVLEVGSETVTAYATADGKNFFPQVVDMDKVASNEKTPPPVVEAAVKKEKPDVDLFVMSFCPFGLQAQKGILPVIEALGDSVNFSMRYVNYIMHDKKEFDENIRQYCIEKEERAKYPAYLSCFTASASGDSAGCGKTAKISEPKNAACVAATDKKFGLTEKFKASTGTYPPFGIDQELNEKYGVQGSPTLVVNGSTLNSARDPKSLLAAICSGFTEQPEACQTELSSQQPSSGFGVGVASAAASNASCN